jgi:hypothetical protein
MGQGRARVALVVLVVAVLPVLVGVWLLPWALRSAGASGHGGTFTVRHCDRVSPITWRCAGSFEADDGMACEGEPGCPSWNPVVLDDPSHREPGATVWATKPIGDQGHDVYPWGWHEQLLIPFAVIAGLTCYLAALVTAAWRRLRLFTAAAAAASIVLLVPVTVWLLA